MNNRDSGKYLSLLGELRLLPKSELDKIYHHAIDCLVSDRENGKISQERYIAVLEDMNCIFLDARVG